MLCLSFLLLPRTIQNSGCRFVYTALPEILGELVYTYSGADEISLDSCQLVPTTHDEGDGLRLCECYS